ncbi:MAG TPA: GTP-binding protein [Legionella sp.]|nr:GTP-binding protein [Legionella sp.]
MGLKRILILGAVRIGKTKLLDRINSENYSEVYNATLVFSSNIIRREHKLWILDTSGREKFRSVKTSFYRGTSVGVYCIDLSQPIIDEAQIKLDIEKFRNHAYDAKLILVGTKIDECSENAQEKLNAIKIENVDARIVTSAKSGFGIATLVDSLFKLTEELNQETNESNAPNTYGVKASSFQEAIKNLENTLLVLPNHKKIAIDEQISALHLSLQMTRRDKAKVIDDFSKNCHEILEGKHPHIMKAVLTLAAIAFVTIIAGLVGFGIGFAAGAWTGPGAFISGVMAGSAAAVSVVAVSGSLGLLAGGCAFFKKSPNVTQSISAVDDAIENIKTLAV